MRARRRRPCGPCAISLRTPSTSWFTFSTFPSFRHEFRRLEEEATASVHRWLDGTVRAAELPPPKVRTKVLLGDPSYEIISEAAREGADLVLIGSKGGDVARTPLIGRVINRVVRSALCSVLVVMGPQGTDPVEGA